MARKRKIVTKYNKVLKCDEYIVKVRFLWIWWFDVIIYEKQYAEKYVRWLK